MTVAYTVRFCVCVFIIHQSGALAGPLCVLGVNISVTTSQFNEQLLAFCNFHIGTAAQGVLNSQIRLLGI